MVIIEKRSTLTAKGQTTVPKAVRQVLRVKGGDQIAFRIEGHRVTVVPVAAPREDPVARKFLAILAADIEKHPKTLEPLSKVFAARMESLVNGKEVALGAPIDGDVDL